jgi:hypothetical protein
VAPQGWPQTRAQAAEIIVALLGALDAERAHTDRMWHDGRRHGAASAEGRCPTHQADVADAYAAGQRATASDLAGGASAFAAGWNACLDRLADGLGHDIPVPHWQDRETAVWTRHHPACGYPHRGCPDAHGCRPGPRSQFGKRAPWDRDPAALVAQARASWGLA